MARKTFFGASTGFEPVASALVEHCSANAEATGLNPVEVPKNFFWGYFAITLLLKLRFTAMVTYPFSFLADENGPSLSPGK